MRLLRVAAFLIWVVVASLAIVGFAAFSPSGGEQNGEAVASSTTVVVGSEWGSISGRVAAMALSSGLQLGAVPQTDEEQIPYLLAFEASAADTTTSTTTEPAPPSTTTTHTHATTTTTRATSTTHTHATTTTTTHAPETTEEETTTFPDSFPAAVERWRGLVEQYFDAGDVDHALSVIDCESGGDPDATNTVTGAGGLFQHLFAYWESRAEAAGWPGADVYDPEANIAVGAWLAYHGGWGHWGSCA